MVGVGQKTNRTGPADPIKMRKLNCPFVIFRKEFERLYSVVILSSDSGFGRSNSENSEYVRDRLHGVGRPNSEVGVGTGLPFELAARAADALF